jgi:hypothetical protein
MQNATFFSEHELVDTQNESLESDTRMRNVSKTIALASRSRSGVTSSILLKLD